MCCESSQGYKYKGSVPQGMQFMFGPFYVACAQTGSFPRCPTFRANLLLTVAPNLSLVEAAGWAR